MRRYWQNHNLMVRISGLHMLFLQTKKICLYRLGHGRATGRCRAWLRWCSSFLRELIRNGMDQPFTGDILHPSSAPILHGIGLARKRDAPFHKQLEPGDKGVRTGFHHNEGAFLHAFQFI